jgi:predicted peptidase
MTALLPGQVSEVISDELDHMVYLPKNYDAEGPAHPFILFLHGGGGVNNPENVKGQSLTKMLIDDTIDVEGGFPFIVLMPIAKHRGWPKNFTALQKVFSKVLDDTNADKKRIYLLGQSMGGHGTFEFIAQHEIGFAAGAPCCGYLHHKESKGSEELKTAVPKLLSTPLWIFHAANDAMVSCSHSDAIVEALEDAGHKNLKYTRYETAPDLPGLWKGKGHASYELAFKDIELYRWLLGFSVQSAAP